MISEYEMETQQQISDKELQTGYWYVTHKLQLKKGAVAFLFLANMAVWGYVAFTLVFAFGIELETDRQIPIDLVQDRFTNIEGVRSVTAPKDIRVLGITTLPSAGDRRDFLASVSNPNDKWYATFTYQFMDGQTPLQRYDGFIMPGEEKLLVDLDVAVSSVTELVIRDVEWSRFLGYEAYAAERNIFSITDSQFVQGGSAENAASDRAVFTLHNQSNFNYIEPSFLVLLRNAGRIVGIQRLSVERILSGQSYPVDIRWFEDVGEVVAIEVVPDIDFISPKSYLPF